MPTEFPEIFDPETQEGNSWDPLPVGEYVAQIVEASVLQPKSGDGCYLALTWKIAEGEFEGRQVWHRITFAHSNEQAQTIGRKTLKDLCVALDVNEQVNDAEVFLFKPARIRLGIEKDKQGLYPDKNKASRILPLEPKPAEPGQPANGGSASTAATGVPKPAVGPGAPAPWHTQR
jgi:Protein of unknown function (DUF669)